MKVYPIKLEVLSPVHIGTGDEYLPLQYLIKNGTYYQFTVEDIYESWSEDIQMQFMEKVDRNDLLGLRRFLVQHLKPEDANYSMAVTDGVERIYQDKFEDLANQLLISPFIRSGTDYQPYIPGSSLKGSVRTGVMNGLARIKRPPNKLAKGKKFEFILLDAQERKNNRWRNIVQKDPFRAIKFTDLFFNNDFMMTGEIKNCGKGRKGRMEFISIQMFKEVVLGKLNNKNTLLTGEMRWDDDLFSDQFGKKAFNRKLDLFELLEMCRQFYQKELDREAAFYKYSQDILKYIERIKKETEQIADNQTLLRMGRFSGVYAVTIDDYRDPRPPKGKGWGKTRNVFDGRFPMGWVKLTVEN